MIQNVWILEKETGRPVFHKRFGSIEAQDVLLSGFLSAVYTFAESEISGFGIESMEMGEYIFVYCFSHNLLFVLAADKEDKRSNLKMQVDYIKNSFLQEFPFVVKGGREFWMNWSGEQTIFQKFNDIIEDLIHSWMDVKITTSIAEKMDILEVFQQLFSRIAKMTFPLFKKGKIKQKLEDKLKETIEYHKHILNVEELSQIFDIKETFLDVLSVNVFNPELSAETVKATIHDLCKSTLVVLEEYMGSKKYSEEFKKHIHPYLKQDWNRIRDLGLDKFFIDYLP